MGPSSESILGNCSLEKLPGQYLDAGFSLGKRPNYLYAAAINSEQKNP
jgi:hypothetical protein